MIADRWSGRAMFRPGIGSLAAAYARRPGPGSRPAHVYYVGNRIAFAQINPFLRYRRMIAARHDVALRFLPAEPLLAGDAAPEPGARHILLQAWFDVDRGALARTLDRLHEACPDATLDFIDAFAPNDLRLAATVEPQVRNYLKKSLFRDRSRHLEISRGDTNLTDYVVRRDGVDWPVTDHDVPSAILPKLRLTPNFFTAPQFFDVFRSGHLPSPERREIDVHARMDLGSELRERLRRPAIEVLGRLPGQHVLSDEQVPWRAFMRELSSSKICISPFGFGELCWRDIEAVMAGAVLVKPDMGHLDTLPELYRPMETYVPVRWDFSDLGEVVTMLLDDAELRRRLAEAAWTVLRDYLREDAFLDDMASLWAD